MAFTPPQPVVLATRLLLMVDDGGKVDFHCQVQQTRRSAL